MALNTEYRIDRLASELATNGRLPNVGECMAIASIFKSHRNKPWRSNALKLPSAVAIADKSRFTALPRRHNKHILNMTLRGEGPQFQGLSDWGEPMWGDRPHFIGPMPNPYALPVVKVVAPVVKRVKVPRVKVAKVVAVSKELVYDRDSHIMIRPGVFVRRVMEMK